MGANLVPLIRKFSIDPAYVGNQHEIDDGCLTPGPHKILRFDFVAQNVGNADFVVGRPIDRPDLFYFTPAHQHYHMKEFNQYKLYHSNGNLAVPSKKPGFCLADVEPVPGMSGGPKKFPLTCKKDEVMGISAGWADVYEADLDCQYLVIDGLPDGDYTLVATTNTAHAIPEDNFEDNTVCQGLHIAGNWVQELPQPPLHVDLVTPTVKFNDVPEGETAARPVEFEVRSCGAVSFSLVGVPTKLTGPAGTTFGTISTPGSSLADEHSVLPRNAFLWLTYKGTAAGDSATGEVKVKCNQTGQEWTVPIIANTIKRPTVAVVLALDQSGSMADPAGTGKKRIDVLHEAGARFMELAQANNGVGLIRFDDKAYPVDGVLKLANPMDLSDPNIVNRPKLVADVNATAPNGATSIGNGLELARNTVDKATGYDNQAIVVFTDGLENTSKYIKDVKDLITQRTFAIGLGTAQQVSTSALTALTKETGGYLLISGALSTAIDDYFRLSKYFLQILAAVTNDSIVKDPTGYIAGGQKIRVPFMLNSSDIDATAILMTDLPIIQFGIETPTGHVVGPAEAIALGATVAAGTNMLYYRFTLPLLGGGKPAHAGVWHAVLGIGDREPAAFVAHGGHYTARYSVSVHAYSNVRMAANLTQSSFEPGATLAIRATLTEFGIPLAGTGHVQAELRRPDGTQTVLSLAEVEPGLFGLDVVASLVGIYQFRVIANGWTHRGEAFTREQLLTGVTIIGGNSPAPTTPPGDHRDDFLCCLLRCLLKNEPLSRLLAQHNIDAAELHRCLSRCCDARNAPPSERELAERERGAKLPVPAVLGRLRELLSEPEFAYGVRHLMEGTGE